MAAKEIARKITVATVTGGPKNWFGRVMAAAKLDEQGEPTVEDAAVRLMAVYGNAVKATHGASDFGEWTKLHGNFRAVNLLTDKDGKELGTVMNSSIVMLPPYLSGALEGALAMDGASAVQFAFEIHAKYAPTAAQKFEYVVFDRMAPTTQDPLLALEVSMGIKPASALLTHTPNPDGEVAAPAAAPAPTAAPAPATKKR